MAEKKLTLTLLSNSKKMTLVSTNEETRAQLSKLKSGDFLSFEGFSNAEQTMLFANSINYVGLKDLIGNWTGDDEHCYKFVSFEVLSVFNKNDKSKCEFNITHLAREFSYFINPSDEGWSALLSDDDDSYLMDLTLNSKNSAELSLYDSKSGDILKQIKIRR